MRPTTDVVLTRRRLAAAGLGVAGLFGLAACGSGDDPTPASPAAGTSPSRSADDTATTEDQPAESTATPSSPPDDDAADGAELGPDGHYAEVQVTENGTKHLIPLEAVQSGGPPKDGIPSIDNPQFVTAEGWDELNYQDDLLVMGVEVDGQRRAYPFQVLVWHELVNEMFNGVPLVVSYCPLCGTGIVFKREIPSTGEVAEFGVSGQLYNSDLLMYDRITDTLWSQISGVAVVGELTGERLEFYPSQLMTWADWRETYPDSEVLTRETGQNRDYDSDPYGGYGDSSSIWFGVAATDDRLHAKERVVGVEIDAETYGAYPEEAVVEFGPVNDLLGETPLLVAADPGDGKNILVFVREVDGETLTFDLVDGALVDQETGSSWDFSGLAVEGELAGSQLTEILPVKGFWFAWFAFHQQTALWQPGE